MKAEIDRSKASFKLDLIETANADPEIKSSDLRLLIAYVSVIEWPSAKAWLSMTLARAKTGLSERQFWTSRARLLGGNDAKRAYLKPVRGSAKVGSFTIINPWRQEALDHIKVMTGHYIETEKHRKAVSRNKQSVSRNDNLSLQKLQGHKPHCPCKFCSPVPAEIAGKYPSISTPRKNEVREEGNQSPNVVLLMHHMKRSAGL